MIVIWRPHRSIKKSIKTFDEVTLSRLCIVEISLILKLFADRLDLSNFDIKIDNEPFIEYYWNNGSPFIWDILQYFKLGRKEWLNNGGEPACSIDEELIKKLHSHKFGSNHCNWSKEQARAHKFILLSIDHFWWKRHFRSDGEYLRRLKRIEFFDKDNIPISITKTQVKKMTVIRQ